MEEIIWIVGLAIGLVVIVSFISQLYSFMQLGRSPDEPIYLNPVVKTTLDAGNGVHEYIFGNS